MHHKIFGVIFVPTIFSVPGLQHVRFCP
jgi:hypothetical protein